MESVSFLYTTSLSPGEPVLNVVLTALYLVRHLPPLSPPPPQAAKPPEELWSSLALQALQHCIRYHHRFDPILGPCHLLVTKYSRQWPLLPSLDFVTASNLLPPPFQMALIITLETIPQLTSISSSIKCVVFEYVHIHICMRGYLYAYGGQRLILDVLIMLHLSFRAGQGLSQAW